MYDYVKANSDGSRSGTKNVTSAMVADWVNEKLELSKEFGYTEMTIRNWLHKLGFKVDENKKVLTYITL